MRRLARGLRAVLLASLPALLAGSPILLASSPCRAGVRVFAVPTQVIYPGDRITDQLLVDAPEAQTDPAGRPDPVSRLGAIGERADLVGKVARRTLLPGKPIPVNAVEEPRAVSVGALVKIIYAEDGLMLSTVAQALQNGYVGQIVQLRNLDSGITVTGKIQPDGSVRISGD